MTFPSPNLESNFNTANPRKFQLNNLLCILILIVFCAFNYAPYLHNQFAVDDHDFLENKFSSKFAHLSDYFTKTASQHLKPVYYLVNIPLFQRFYDSPFIPRLLNLFLFTIDSILLFCFINILTKNRKLALTASLLFCVHPFQSDVMNWITQNFMFIFSIFMKLSLLALYFYSSNSAHRRIFYFLSTISFLVALLTFEAALLYPAYAFAMLLFFSKRNIQNIIKDCISFLTIGILYFTAYLFICRDYHSLTERAGGLNLTVFSYLATFSHLVAWYCAKYFLPLSIVFMKNTAPNSDNILLWNLASASVVMLLILMMLKHWEKNLKSFAVLWFVIGLALALPASLAHDYMGMVFEPHWMYFSSIGIYLLAALFLQDAERHIGSSISWIILLCLILYFSFLTHQYNENSRTEQSYCRYWSEHAPTNPIPLFRLAACAENPTQASEYLYKAMSVSTYRKDKIYSNIALIQMNKGNLDESQKMIDTSLKLNPSDSFAHNVQGAIYVSTQNFSAAEAEFDKALELKPIESAAAVNLIELYLLTQQTGKAVNLYSKLSEFHLPPEPFQSVLCRLALAFYLEGDTLHYHRVIEQIAQRKNDSSGFIELAMLFINTKHLEAVLPLLQKALSHYPKDTELYLLTGQLYAEQGQYLEALDLWEKGYRLNPKDIRFINSINQLKKLFVPH